jgi:hypothetical protein
LPEGSKMLVIPIFFPMIPFIASAVCALHGVEDSQLGKCGFNPCLLPTFSFLFQPFGLDSEVPGVNKP